VVRHGVEQGPALSVAASARERYEQVSREDSDIQGRLPRLRAWGSGTVLELGVWGGNSTTAFPAAVEEHGWMLWSVDIDPGCSALFKGHPQWRAVQADGRDAATVAAAGCRTRSTSCSSTRCTPTSTFAARSRPG
jgi:hypothetical protein